MEGGSSEVIECPVCTTGMGQLFVARVLNKYDVRYYQCSGCGLLKTETPYWQDEAYDSAIASLDVGIVRRNVRLSEIIGRVVAAYFDSCGKFLDFAGGYGLLVRLMRDKGFDFYWHDKYCQNIFARYFDVPSLSHKNEPFELITALEVLEHIADPVDELKKMFEVTDSVLISTELLPSGITSVDDWWYFVPETGQHITFYTEKSLHELADKLAVHCYSDGKSFHVLSRKIIRDFSFSPQPAISFTAKVRRLLSQKLALPVEKGVRNERISINNDFAYLKNKLGNE